MERKNQEHRKVPVEAEFSQIGKRVTFGKNVRIRSKNVFIGDDCTIADNTDVFAPDGFTLGKCSYLGEQTRIKCWRFNAGDYLFFEREVEVGQGGCLSGPNSTVDIGGGVFCGVRVIINPSNKVIIGSGTGIGAHVGIWTHGAWNPIIEGYPADFAPVTIGSKVWLTGRSQVLPGVNIGNHAVVGMMSLVNRDVPEGAFAGGIPIKILKENAYPKKLSNLKRQEALNRTVRDYIQQAKWKGLRPAIAVLEDSVVIDGTGFDFKDMKTCGKMDDVAEDFRDFLRRHGIRFLTGKPFKSIPHPEVAKWS